VICRETEIIIVQSLKVWKVTEKSH
jgi:hypothetical protein